jgi:hypothetical protein
MVRKNQPIKGALPSFLLASIKNQPRKHLSFDVISLVLMSRLIKKI